MTAPWPAGTVDAITFTGPERVEFRRTPIPGPQPGHVLIQAAYVGLCGTDRELYLGTHAYLAGGQSAYPFVPGHEWSGTVLAVAPGVLDLAVGDRVVGDPFVTCGRCRACRAQRRNVCARRAEIGVRGGYPGAAAGIFRVPERVCTRIPPAVDMDHAVLAEPAVTVLSGLRRTRTGPGDRVVIIGTGTLGLIAVSTARAMGADVDAVGVEEHGLAAARRIGAGQAMLPADVPSGGYDVVVEAAGAPDGLAQSIRLAAPAGRIAILGTPAGSTTTETTDLVAKDLELHGVLGGVEHYATTLGLIERGVIDPTALIARVHPAADAAVAYRSLAHDVLERPKLLLKF